MIVLQIIFALNRPRLIVQCTDVVHVDDSIFDRNPNLAVLSFHFSTDTCTHHKYCFKVLNQQKAKED